MTDPIADMLTRIRNAAAVKKTEVSLPYSKIKLAIAKILEREGWIARAELIKSPALSKNQSAGFDELKLTLKYEGKKPKISSLKRISRPGLRIYVPTEKLPRVLNGLGIAIISTSQGLMTGKEAKIKKVGGEVLCEIY